MAEDFQPKYVAMVGIIMGGIILIVGILGIIFNLE